MHLKSGLIRGVVSLEGSSLVVFCCLIASGIWPDKRVVFLEGSSLVVFCYLIASEIWRDKRGGLSRGKQFSSILLSQCM